MKKLECNRGAGQNEITYSADLIMLDMKMPGKSGMELLPEIKTNYPGYRRDYGYCGY